MTKVKLISFLFLLLISSAFAFTEKDYAKMLKEGNAIGVDVRTRGELLMNPATGALHIPLSKVTEKSPQLDRSKTILIFCESGYRSKSAMNVLKGMGFKKVVNIIDWRTWNRIKKD